MADSTLTIIQAFRPITMKIMPGKEISIDIGGSGILMVELKVALKVEFIELVVLNSITKKYLI